MNKKKAIIVAGLVLGITVTAATVWSRPSPDSDMTYKEWFEGLRQPGTHAHCCSIADCRTTAYRTTSDGYEVPINDRWVRVPSEKVLDRIENPTGKGVVCYTLPANILCFVRATDS